jgi:uncharacterized protein YlzI (FlbEa/FlbD family)
MVLRLERPVDMATRIVFLSGQDTTVTETEEEVVQAVQRDHPDPVMLEGLDGLVVYVNWSHITSITPAPEPRPA